MTHQASIIIPNWNGKHHLDDCLASLRRQTFRSFVTILVDNGSHDGSVEHVEMMYPEVQVIRLPQNRGFAAAVNRGIHASTSEYVGLLNNDTAVQPDWLERLVKALDADPSLGSVACKMLNFADHSMLDGAGDMLSVTCAPYTRAHGVRDDGSYDQADEVFGACAGAALYRRSLFDSVGVFDEKFVSYYEDADLAFRAQLAGFRCLYVPGSVCYHKRNATGGLRTETFILMHERNLLCYYVKNIPLGLLFTRFALILGARLREANRLRRTGAAKALVSAWVEAARLLPDMLEKRRAIQKHRVVPLRHFKSFMGKPIRRKSA